MLNPKNLYILCKICLTENYTANRSLSTLVLDFYYQLLPRKTAIFVFITLKVTS